MDCEIANIDSVGHAARFTENGELYFSHLFPDARIGAGRSGLEKAPATRRRLAPPPHSGGKSLVGDGGLKRGHSSSNMQREASSI
jgi:hypothetical protein